MECRRWTIALGTTSGACGLRWSTRILCRRPFACRHELQQTSSSRRGAIGQRGCSPNRHLDANVIRTMERRAGTNLDRRHRRHRAAVECGKEASSAELACQSEISIGMVSADRRVLAVAEPAGAVHLLKLSSDLRFDVRNRKTVQVGDRAIDAIALTTDGSRSAVSSEGQVTIWDTSPQKPISGPLLHSAGDETNWIHARWRVADRGIRQWACCCMGGHVGPTAL